MSESDSPEVVREQVESAASNNVATIANGPGFFTNQLFALSINSAASWVGVQQAIAGKVSESIIHTSPSEGASALLAQGMALKSLQSSLPAGADR